MKPEIKQRWVNALRSGEYSQGRYQLRNSENHFCCLGVLCDLYLKEQNKEWVKGEEQFSYLAPSVDGNSGEVLTNDVIEWAGLKFHNPELTIGNEQTVISDLNDSLGKTFEEIAQLIEAQL